MPIPETFMKLRALILGAVCLLAPAVANAQSIPHDFDRYPVKSVHKGKVKLPDFRGRDKDFASYRTRITQGMKEGPNFAGKIALIEIGCGTGCRFVSVGDVSTGRMYPSFPLGGEENYRLDLHYRPTSRLVVAYWVDMADDKCMREDYEWTGKDFRQISKKAIGAGDDCWTLAGR